MKTIQQKHGVLYVFDNDYTLSVLTGWAAMADDSRPYEFMAWGEDSDSTDAIGYQTKEDIDKIITMFEENNQDEIEAFFKKYKAPDHESVYYDPYADYDQEDDYYSDYEKESRQRVPGIQKEIQEVQAELDEQLRILGDSAKPIILIKVTRQGHECYDGEFYTTITCLNLHDGQIIDDLTQESTSSYNDYEYCCTEEIDALCQLEPLKLYLKLAKAGYKVIATHKL